MWKDPWSTGLSQQHVLFTNGELRFSKWEAVLSSVSSVQVAVWQRAMVLAACEGPSFLSSSSEALEKQWGPDCTALTLLS